VLRRQRAHLLKELRSLADARALGPTSAVVSVLITAAELHVRADLGVVDAAEQVLGDSPEVSSQRLFRPTGAHRDELVTDDAGAAGGGPADSATG
jgi:hypothetical protein